MKIKKIRDQSAWAITVGEMISYGMTLIQTVANTLVISSQNELLDEKHFKEDYSSLVNKTCIICAQTKLFSSQCSDLFQICMA